MEASITSGSDSNRVLGGLRGQTYQGRCPQHMSGAVRPKERPRPSAKHGCHRQVG